MVKVLLSPITIPKITICMLVYADIITNLISPHGPGAFVSGNRMVTNWLWSSNLEKADVVTRVESDVVAGAEIQQMQAMKGTSVPSRGCFPWAYFTIGGATVVHVVGVVTNCLCDACIFNQKSRYKWLRFLIEKKSTDGGRGCINCIAKYFRDYHTLSFKIVRWIEVVLCDMLCIYRCHGWKADPCVDLGCNCTFLETQPWQALVALASYQVVDVGFRLLDRLPSGFKGPFVLGYGSCLIKLQPYGDDFGKSAKPISVPLQTQIDQEAEPKSSWVSGDSKCQGQVCDLTWDRNGNKLGESQTDVRVCKGKLVGSGESIPVAVKTTANFQGDIPEVIIATKLEKNSMELMEFTLHQTDGSFERAIQKGYKWSSLEPYPCYECHPPFMDKCCSFGASYLFTLKIMSFQLVLAVAMLEEIGIVHRDLKMSNMLIQDNGKIIIIDLESACMTPSSYSSTLDEPKPTEIQSCTTSYHEMMTKTAHSLYFAPPPVFAAGQVSNTLFGILTSEEIDEIIGSPEENLSTSKYDTWAIGMILSAFTHGRLGYSQRFHTLDEAASSIFNEIFDKKKKANILNKEMEQKQVVSDVGAPSEKAASQQKISAPEIAAPGEVLVEHQAIAKLAKELSVTKYVATWKENFEYFPFIELVAGYCDASKTSAEKTQEEAKLAPGSFSEMDASDNKGLRESTKDSTEYTSEREYTGSSVAESVEPGKVAKSTGEETSSQVENAETANEKKRQLEELQAKQIKLANEIKSLLHPDKIRESIEKFGEKRKDEIQDSLAKEEFEKFWKMITGALEPDPTKRSKAKDMLKSEYFNGIDEELDRAAKELVDRKFPTEEREWIEHVKKAAKTREIPWKSSGIILSFVITLDFYNGSEFCQFQKFSSRFLSRYKRQHRSKFILDIQNNNRY